jgi:hypothetical protein
MQVKAVQGSNERLYSCTHVVKSELPGIGIRIQLCGADAGVPPHIDLPTNADKVYVTENGKTIAVYKAPMEVTA